MSLPITEDSWTALTNTIESGEYKDMPDHTLALPVLGAEPEKHGLQGGGRHNESSLHRGSKQRRSFRRATSITLLTVTYVTNKDAQAACSGVALVSSDCPRKMRRTVSGRGTKTKGTVSRVLHLEKPSVSNR